MRLIDVDELLKAPFRIEGKFGGKYPFEAITIKMIEAAPTVDATPVVRCGECVCEVSTEKTREASGALWCKYKLQPCEPSDFCSHGERRTIKAEK